MRKISVAAAIALTFMGIAAPVAAQPYDGYGYRERGGYGYGSRYRGGGFDARGYMRCNPDVARAVRRGQFESPWHHYRTYGRREGRAPGC